MLLILLSLQGQQQSSQDRQSRELLIFLFLQGKQRSSQDRLSIGGLLYSYSYRGNSRVVRIGRLGSSYTLIPTGATAEKSGKVE